MLFRPDVKIILENQIVQNTISVGKYDMTFKSMVPIFSDNEMIGIFEVITHFNSISKRLEDNSIDSVIIANKKYIKKLIFPLTKKFVGEYYIANMNAKDEIINTLEQNDIEKILQSKDYLILKDRLVVVQAIELKNLAVGFAIMTKKLDEIDIKSIEIAKKRLISYVIFFIVLVGILFLLATYYFYTLDIKKLNKDLEKNLQKIKNQEKKNQTILDSQKNIIVITNGVKLQNANKQLFAFFEEYSSLNEFKKDYDCICETFIDMDDDSYVKDKDYDGKNWAEYILSKPQRKFNAAIKKGDKIHHFTLNVTLTHFDNEESPFIIVTLTDITKLIENNIKVKEKDRLLFQQNKMASMGEMLSNIAHQWRQPLSMISGISSSMIVKKELNLLEMEEINSSCERILKNTEYLSKTIEDFRNFFKQEKQKDNFNILKSINENLNLLKDRLKEENIEIILDVDKEAEIFGFKNEFQQAILNILNNSIDAFNLGNNIHRKLILISYNNKILSIKDSAGGIKEEILDKIFEPYFTTKHQTQGTGIGLYMTQEILTKHMNCNLDVKNSTFDYENNTYKGVNFIIEFKDKSTK